MLNVWDVIAIFIIGVLFYAIINQIIMGICAKAAIDKAEKLGCTRDEIYEYADKKIKESTDLAIKAIKDKYNKK